MIDLIISICKTAVSFPTVILTGLLVLAILYWIISALTGAGGEVDGAVDGVIEGLMDGVAEGAVDSLFEGVAEGAVDGVAEGLMDGAAEGVMDGAAEGVMDAAAEPSLTYRGLGKMFGCLGLTAVPVTIFASLVLLSSWGVSLLLSRLLGRHVSLATGGLLFGGGILLAAFVFGVLLTALIIHPFKPLFRTAPSLKRRDLVGRVATLRTLSVDDDFGQAEVEDGQAGILLDVRCLQANTLTRGDRVEITRYDPTAEVYLVAAQPVAGDEGPQDREATASEAERDARGSKPMQRR